NLAKRGCLQAPVREHDAVRRCCLCIVDDSLDRGIAGHKRRRNSFFLRWWGWLELRARRFALLPTAAGAASPTATATADARLITFLDRFRRFGFGDQAVLSHHNGLA